MLKMCMPVSRLGLSAPFFKSGWGDLGVVSFEEAEPLLKGWPPEHFDTKVRPKPPACADSPCGNDTKQAFHLMTHQALYSSLWEAHWYCQQRGSRFLQVEWSKSQKGTKYGTQYELLEGSFR